jgi:hypothetical protein
MMLLINTDTDTITSNPNINKILLVKKLDAWSIVIQTFHVKMVGVEGFEPTHPEETDLQSAVTRHRYRTPINWLQWLGSNQRPID